MLGIAVTIPKVGASGPSSSTRALRPAVCTKSCHNVKQLGEAYALVPHNMPHFVRDYQDDLAVALQRRAPSHLCTRIRTNADADERDVRTCWRRCRRWAFVRRARARLCADAVEDDSAPLYICDWVLDGDGMCGDPCPSEPEDSTTTSGAKTDHNR